MSLLNRYILGAYFRIFFLALGAFLGIYLLVEFFERVDDFLEHQARLSLYVLYFLNKIPQIVSQVTPLAVLMGVFMTVGGFGRTNELTAMRAGGVSLLRISTPLLAVSLATTLGVMAINEYLLPLSVKKSNYIFRTEVGGKPEVSFKRDRVWFREGDKIVNVRLALPEKETLQGISIYDLNDDFHLDRRIDAAQAAYENNHWRFEKVTERLFTASGNNLEKVVHLPDKEYKLSKTPEDFKSTVAKNEELGFRQLRQLAHKLKAEGYDATRYRVDMHSRLATPFSCLIMAFLGIPFALQKGRGANLATGVTISVAIGIGYFILQAILLAFGYSGVIPPLVAAWSANILFGLMSIWLMLFARD